MTNKRPHPSRALGVAASGILPTAANAQPKPPPTSDQEKCFGTALKADRTLKP